MLLKRDDLSPRIFTRLGDLLEDRPLLIALPCVVRVLEQAVDDAADAKGGLDHRRRDVLPVLCLGLLRDLDHVFCDRERLQRGNTNGLSY